MIDLAAIQKLKDEAAKRCADRAELSRKNGKFGRLESTSNLLRSRHGL